MPNLNSAIELNQEKLSHNKIVFSLERLSENAYILPSSTNITRINESCK
jgi:hypothetical protein